MTLQTLNQSTQEEAAAVFRRCCNAENWVAGMVEARPFKRRVDLFLTADDIWSSLEEEDYLEAFDGHPKIGDVNSLKEKYATTRTLASNEQSGVNTTSEEILNSLADSNEEYIQKNGFIFIVCATGKTAAQMLSILKERLKNSRDEELLIATEEQRKITAIRLEKLL